MRAVLRGLVLSLARNPDVVRFASELLSRVPSADRLGRLAALFTFVSHLVDVPPAPEGACKDGVEHLLLLAGEEEGPAVILAALLLAGGEKASLEWAPGLAFVRVEIGFEDLSRLPPHAGLLRRAGRYYVPLDARRARGSFAFLPRLARAALNSSPVRALAR